MAKKKKKSAEDEEETKSKKPLIIGGVVAAALVYNFVLKPAPEPEEPIDEAAERVIEEGEIFPMEEIVVNLADDDENRYLRVGLALVLEAGTPSIAMETEAPIAIDAAIDYLSAQTFEDLQADGSKTKVRDELSTLIRAAYDDEKVVRVLFTTFVMQ